MDLPGEIRGMNFDHLCHYQAAYEEAVTAPSQVESKELNALFEYSFLPRRNVPTMDSARGLSMLPTGLYSRATHHDNPLPVNYRVIEPTRLPNLTEVSRQVRYEALESIAKLNTFFFNGQARRMALFFERTFAPDHLKMIRKLTYRGLVLEGTVADVVRTGILLKRAGRIESFYPNLLRRETPLPASLAIARPDLTEEALRKRLAPIPDTAGIRHLVELEIAGAEMREHDERARRKEGLSLKSHKGKEMGVGVGVGLGCGRGSGGWVGAGGREVMG